LNFYNDLLHYDNIIYIIIINNIYLFLFLSKLQSVYLSGRRIELNGVIIPLLGAGPILKKLIIFISLK